MTFDRGRKTLPAKIYGVSLYLPRLQELEPCLKILLSYKSIRRPRIIDLKCLEILAQLASADAVLELRRRAQAWTQQGWLYLSRSRLPRSRKGWPILSVRTVQLSF
jgi:hypothetical protein